jgi:DNA-binding NarL/FixJ family response regulator
MEPRETTDAEGSESRTAPVRVLLVDDQQLVREGLRSLLSAEEEILVVDEADSAATALAACARSHPDVLLVDAMLPEMATPSLIREVRALYPEMQIIAIAECAEIQCGVLHPGATPIHHCLLLESGQVPQEDCLEQALLAGARGALRKTSSRAELLQAIREVAPGKYWMELTTALRMIDHLQQPRQPATERAMPVEGLKRREVEVIRELISGGSNKQIGASLGISEQAVKNAISRVLTKLKLESRTQIALYAVETRLLERYASLLTAAAHPPAGPPR